MLEKFRFASYWRVSLTSCHSLPSCKVSMTTPEANFDLYDDTNDYEEC